MSNKFGSTWHRWDFHIHTPYSILNNNYGFNPFEIVDEQENEKAFDTYVQTLFTRAIENNIVAIGITDYFMIEGYKRIVNNYLNNPEKMTMLFPDETIRQKVEELYVFPNIELRLNTFVGEDAKSVNYHVVFSNLVSIQDIEENFLHRLNFHPDAKGDLTLTRANIESYGRKLKRENGHNGSDLMVGLRHVTVSDDDVLEILSKNLMFSGQYIITIPVDEDLSEVSWDGRDYTTRKNLYQQCHCYMTSNAKTRAWAIAKDEEEERIKEFGSIKPCIWGSDAHEYERMFAPANDRYCWIKAEPSFDGLLQILYEPEERVAIQHSYPDEKDAHQIIQSIQFEDINFQEEPIVFNDYLTCIIGGKSTGKSLLLHQLAMNIDSIYTAEQEKVLGQNRKQFSVKKATVLWKDGTSGSRKIVYIPQTFLNRTIDNPEKTTAINQIIADVLQQELEISRAFSEMEDDVKRIHKHVQADIGDYCEYVSRLQELEADIKREGTTEAFAKTLEQLETERDELVNRTNIKQEDIERYAKLEEEIRLSENRRELGKQEIHRLSTLENPIVIVPKFFVCNDGIKFFHSFQENFSYVGEQLENVVNSLSERIQPDWNKTCDLLVHDMEKMLTELERKIRENKAEYDKLKIMVEQNEQLQKLSVRISAERKKLQEARKREENKEKLVEKINYLKRSIIGSQKEYFESHSKYCNVVIATGTKKNTSLSFDAKAIWKQKDFLNGLGNIFDNRNYSSFFSEYGFDLGKIDSVNYNEKFLNSLWTAMTEPQKFGGLTIKSAYTLQSALQQIFGNWYNIHYIVKSGNDTIEEMSPGKKALVLLELLISLEDSKCPILIDQPEDDLDNRSIYDDLVQYIKLKKKERQIIVVTHNANVVLGADAEEVIIANQDGKDTENASKRFEYRSGAIENDIAIRDKTGNLVPGILNRDGIQTQICDILEGGRPAFELRKNKYMRIS